MNGKKAFDVNTLISSDFHNFGWPKIEDSTASGTRADLVETVDADFKQAEQKAAPFFKAMAADAKSSLIEEGFDARHAWVGIKEKDINVLKVVVKIIKEKLYPKCYASIGALRTCLNGISK